MSNPVLRLETTGEFTIDTIGEMLYMDLASAEYYALGGGEYSGAMFGQIGVTWLDPERDTYPMGATYDLNWTIALEFRCPRYWNRTRSSLMITLFELMIVHEEPALSDYLVWLDTGEVLYFLKDGNLKINENYNKELQLYMPYEATFFKDFAVTYEDLLGN